MIELPAEVWAEIGIKYSDSEGRHHTRGYLIWWAVVVSVPAVSRSEFYEIWMKAARAKYTRIYELNYESEAASFEAKVRYRGGQLCSHTKNEPAAVINFVLWGDSGVVVVRGRWRPGDRDGSNFIFTHRGIFIEGYFRPDGCADVSAGTAEATAEAAKNKSVCIVSKKYGFMMTALELRECLSSLYDGSETIIEDVTAAVVCGVISMAATATDFKKDMDLLREGGQC